MNITLESDYAIRIVGVLVRENRRIDARSIAEKTGVTLRFSLKILHKLVSAGILCSFKGAQGGYQLFKKPIDINLNDIIEIIEGPFTFCRCVDSEYDCTHENPCYFKPVFHDIADSVQAKLKSVNFSQIDSLGGADLI